MTLSDQIKEWLKSGKRDFQKGLQMYIEASHNRSVMLYLQRKADMNKLIYELQKLLRIAPARLEKIPAIQFIAVASIGSRQPGSGIKADTRPSKQKKVDKSKLPTELKDLHAEISEMYKKQRVIHEKIKLSGDDKKRAALRADLVRIDDFIADGWTKIDTFVKTGKYDKKPKPPAKTETDSLRVINSARSYISKGITAMGKLEGEKAVQRSAEILKRVDVLVKHNVSVKPETRADLIRLGVIKEDHQLKVELK